jgi:hypothetical protein
MRHFLLPGPVTALAFGMGMTAAPRGLDSGNPSGLDGCASCLISTPRCSSGDPDRSDCK